MASGKTIIIALGAVLLGFLGGSWTGGSKNRQLQEELDRTRSELETAQKKAQASAPFAMGLQSLLQSRKSEPVPSTHLPVANQAPGVQASPTPTGESDSASKPGLEGTQPGTEDRKKALEAMAATWRLRATQARAAFLDSANLTPAQKTALDKTVGHLNQEVKVAVGQALEKVNFENPQRRDMVDLAVAMGNIYLDIDDEMRQNLTEEQMNTLNQSVFDILTQVDPAIVMPLLQKIDTPQ